MKKSIVLALILILAITVPVYAAEKTNNGVDDLRGRWDVSWSFDHTPEVAQDKLTWLIQDIEPHPDQENVFLANGCMRTQGTGKLAPLALVATYHPQTNSYTLLLYSTVIPAEWEPFVIRFNGEALIYGSGVSDDRASGAFISDPGAGAWSARHHDRRRPSCAGMENSGLRFQADVYAHKDLAQPTPQYWKLYEAFTNIVSSGMLVETPDGETVLVPPYNDIYTPDVDFVSTFRFLIHMEGPPLAGDAYHFTLLDILGNPIPGANSQDIWTGCQQTAPVDIEMTYAFEDSLHMSWTSAPDAPGWDPDGDPQFGFYQIGVSPQFESPTSYGANGIASNTHLIPWAPFTPGSPGVPDGSDMGVSLSELDDGSYEVYLGAFAQVPPGSAGFGWECAVHDSSQFLGLSKQGSQITLTTYGSISGQVSTQDGAPLEGIWVDACEYSDQPDFCRSAQTDANGDYRITGLHPGDYRVHAGGGEWLNMFYDGKIFHHEAAPVNVTSGEDTPGIDFHLSLAGSIAGVVTDASGNPIEVAYVLACEYNGGYCMDTWTGTDGGYTLMALPAGEFRVEAHADGYAGEYYDNQYDWNLATPVLVNAGAATLGIDFWLEQSPP